MHVLWIGSFLSRHRGSKGVSESLSENLANEAISSDLASHFENKILRLFHIVVKILCTKADIVHIDVFSGSAFTIADIASRIARWRNIKIIMTLHGGKLQEYDEVDAKRVNQVFSRADYLQSPSQFLMKYFNSKNYQVHYMPNSIALQNFPYNRSQVEPFTILWIRGFMPVYNPKMAIDILSEVKKKFPQAKLSMVGPDKGLLKETLNYASQLNCREDVNVVGAIPNTELYTYYQKHQVYINTTSYESFGVALVEAAACGIPMVSTDVGEIPHLWKHNENIILIPQFNKEAFASAIEKIFTENDFANMLSKNAAERAATFSWDNIKPKWIQLLQLKNFKAV
jgi:glycosyltransferase involved in cell wall biosynthesis